MKRPFGFTILAVLFAWLTMAGFAYAWASARVSPAQLSAFHLHAPVMALCGIAYGAAALAAAIGLWRCRAWVLRAILAWGVIVLLGLASFQSMIGMRGEPWWLVVLPHVMLGAIAALIYRYVDRRLPSATERYSER